MYEHVCYSNDVVTCAIYTLYNPFPDPHPNNHNILPYSRDYIIIPYPVHNKSLNALIIFIDTLHTWIPAVKAHEDGL